MYIIRPQLKQITNHVHVQTTDKELKSDKEPAFRNGLL